MATGPRPGPVFLSVPFDVAQQRSQPTRIVEGFAPPSIPDATACCAAAAALMNAQRPLLVLGNGARASAREALQLAVRLGIPVVATGHAKGTFPESHPLYLGIIGNAGHPSANDYIASRPDVVCIVGSRVGDFCTNGWRLDLAGTRATIQIDRESLLIGRNLNVNLGIVGDSTAVLRAIIASLPDGCPPELPTRPKRRMKPWSVAVPPGLVKPQAALAALSEAFPDAIWCSDIGEHMGFAQHYLTIDQPERFQCMSGLASMGSGLGAAVGIKHAARDARVIALVGDGGFNMHASEVLTCVEQNIGVIFAIFNDGRWNMVDHGFRAVFRSTPSGLPARTADLAAVARGYGAAAEVIDDIRKLAPQRLRSLVQPDRPLVLDIRIDPSEALSVDSRSAALLRSKDVA